jgi:hypothetical protein
MHCLERLIPRNRISDVISQPTGYARLNPVPARLTLIAVFAMIVFCVAVAVSPLANNRIDDGKPLRPADVQLYQAEVDRIHAGEGYYQAAAAELTIRGYPTRSVFNWRMPLPMWLLGKMPSLDWGKTLLGGMSLLLLLTAFEALSRDGNNRILRPVGAASLLVGALLPTILGSLCVMPVLWAGVLIAISLCAYGVNRSGCGVVFGIAALFFRELALPYCLLSAVLAWRNHQRRELVQWTIGLSLWLLFFAWHVSQVFQVMTPGALAHHNGWIQFGGAAFVISTIQMNAYLLVLPQWVAAVYFVAGMVGFAGWHTPLGTRFGLTACLFVLAFSAVGQNFNQYWGSLIAPLFCLGVVRFPASLRDLWHAAAPRTVASPSPLH